MDAKNSPIQHVVVATLSLAVVAIFRFALDMPWPMAFARVSFIVLFLILIIGPLKKLGRTGKNTMGIAAPWEWRGELGIWFTVTALMHFILLWLDRPLFQMIRVGGSGYSLANLLGFVALVWAIVLAITSLQKVIVFLGLAVWKWLHGFTYVVFYLSTAHILYFQFFSTYGEDAGPDWFGYTMLVMAILIMLLQAMASITVLAAHRKKISK